MQKRKRMEHDMPESVIHAINLLQSRLESGCEIIEQDGEMCLFDLGGECIASGDTLREMIYNLIKGEI